MGEVSKRSENDFDVSVEWAPAYELVVAYTSFVEHKLHALMELGNAWVRRLRLRLPADFNARRRQLDELVDARAGKSKYDDLLWILAHVAPGPRDTASFLDWLAHLSAGDAYEALAPTLPASGAGLPRDFRAWRDGLVGLLRDFDTSYFAEIDPAILDGLRRGAETLQARVDAVPARELVEEVTNGMWLEPTADLHHIVLVPQYHCRPFNDLGQLQHGLIVLFPHEALPPPPGSPPTGLLRLTRGLADESRLRILRFLGANGPRTLTEVARFARLSQPTVHHHLALLRAAGLVRVYVPFPGPSRYGLSPHALGALAEQLGTYLEPDKQ
ncbi:MAG TPA: winged helix-turn-helix domain-containing protein [Chloroflexota bacterium]|nr:winged helix-turn-helix domain-containing protein [Chloroflexota bacterium]